mgnify:FL=1
MYRFHVSALRFLTVASDLSSIEGAYGKRWAAKCPVAIFVATDAKHWWKTGVVRIL